LRGPTAAPAQAAFAVPAASNPPIVPGSTVIDTVFEALGAMESSFHETTPPCQPPASVADMNLTPAGSGASSVAAFAGPLPLLVTVYLMVNGLPEYACSGPSALTARTACLITVTALDDSAFSPDAPEALAR